MFFIIISVIIIIRLIIILVIKGKIKGHHMSGEDTNKFDCKHCGSCCRNNKPISLTLYDIVRISEFLGMDADDFYRGYCVERSYSENHIPMPFLKKKDNQCCFLFDNLCMIHFVKPDICRYMPSTIFGDINYLKSKMPGCCNIQLMSSNKVNDNNQIQEDWLISMILTTIYYSNYGTFKYELARPYIYRILLSRKNRKGIWRLIDDYLKVKNNNDI